MAIMKGRKANGDLGEVALTNDGEMKTDLNVDSEGLATEVTLGEIKDALINEDDSSKLDGLDYDDNDGNGIVFQESGVTSDNGVAYDIESGKLITIGITGNSGGKTIYFECLDFLGNWNSIKAFNPVTSVISSTTTGTSAETWQIGIEGYKQVRIRIGSSAGGIDVLGKVTT